MGSLSITIGHVFLIHNRKHIPLYLYSTKLIPCFRFSSRHFCGQERFFSPFTWTIVYQNCISPSLRDSEDGHARYRTWEKNAFVLLVVSMSLFGVCLMCPRSNQLSGWRSRKNCVCFQIKFTGTNSFFGVYSIACDMAPLEEFSPN